MDWKNTVLGLELGSTRIKAILLDRSHRSIAFGSFEWENQFQNGIWTYDLNTVHKGVQACYAVLKQDVFDRYAKKLTEVGAIGISGMMHGYLPFDKNGNQLAAFRTWRNTITGEAAEKLTALFSFNIPQRWSIAHLYHAMLNGEAHLKDLAHLTTIAGYIHERLTGLKSVGIGEASGIFPIDSKTLDYDANMVRAFDTLIEESNYNWRLKDVLPKVLVAGEPAGTLTVEGARFLDPDGDLIAGIPFAPPEGDAGTGMVATNSVRVHTGNVSAGTSDFAMVVVDRVLGMHREIDMVTTPNGTPVAMVHCNNCTSDINAWVHLFSEFAETFGMKIDKATLFETLFQTALRGDADCGGLMSFNYFSGEGVTGFNEGRPLFARQPNATFTLANFMRTHLLSALATLKIGLDILIMEEQVEIDRLYGHGGFFKTPGVGQRMLSATVNAPVSAMETADDGGSYGMALLAAYLLWKENDEVLPDYLDRRVFTDVPSTTVMATDEEVRGFTSFLDAYKRALPLELAAIEALR